MLLRSIIDVILPRFCVICGRRLMHEETAICLHCNVHLPRTYLWENPTDNLLARRFWGRIPIERAASYIFFNPKTDTASTIYDIKYHSDWRLAKQLGTMMAKEIGDEFFEDVDGIVPIPIPPKRKRKRGYNQSEMLAKGISSVVGVPVLTKVVKRVKDGVSQTTLTHNERYENISEAFLLQPKAGSGMRGKHVIVLDDVITTGATSIECARELLRIPGIRISILSFACVRNIK